MERCSFLESFGAAKTADLACSLCSEPQKVFPLEFGVLHDESRSLKMPDLEFSHRSMIALLSAYAMGVQGMPSSLYCWASLAKTVTRKNCCSFSLAKLMQSCSNEFTSKNSKP